MDGDNDFAQVPFLTREMLKFGKTAKLELRVTSIATAVTTISIRGVTRSGVVSFVHTTAATSQQSSTNFLIDDVPTVLSITPAASGFYHGNVWASVSLMVNGQVVFPMVSGFVTGAKGLSWPSSILTDTMPGYGQITLLQPADPAVGNNFSRAVQSGEKWKMLYATFYLTTNATVAARRVRFSNEINATIFASTFGSVDQAASTTKTYVIAKFGAIPTEENSNIILVPMPHDFWFDDVDTVNIIVANMQAGDQLSSIALVYEKFYKGG